MIFERIRFTHFRCFSDYALTFKPGINLLFGVNGSGKTCILRGLKIAMSSYFSGFSDDNTRILGITNGDFMSEVHEGREGLEKPVLIDYVFSEYGHLILKRTGKKNRTSIAGIKNLRDDTKKTYEDLSIEDDGSVGLPLFASFSTEDIHSTRKLSISKFIKYYPPRSFGYYECLQGDGFFDYWMHRLLVLKEGQKSLPEIQVVEQAIEKCLGAGGCNIISQIFIRPIQNKIYFGYIDGREVEAGNLSDGYKRLVNIVTDIAIRSYLLNGKKYGLDCCQHTSGVVLIDEIDLHLHPELQSLVLTALRETFPCLQFIVSSHAPMIMSSVKTNNNNEVLYLQYHDGQYTATPIITYGLDASTILETYMGRKARVAEVEEKLNHLFALIDEEQFEKAKIELDSMRKDYSDTLPELSRAESMLSFWETN